MDNIEIIKARKLLEKTQTFSTITTKSTVYNVNLTVYPVLNTTYENIGSKTNNGITFNPTTIFLNEKSAPGEVTADGDYYINYITGRIRVKSGANAAGGVTLTYYVSEQYNYLDADIEIGAVELKDGDTDNRANIKAANTARTTGTIVLATQNVDNEGGVLKESTQTAIKTAVEIMDDWDESDRAKVNPIVGQAGIAGGTGVDGATVPRVSLATNVPLPAGTNTIGKVTITPSAQASVYQTTAYAASGVIKNSAGSFYGLFGYNSKTSDQYLQLHNATSVPADTAVPLAVIAIPAESTFSIDCQTVGIPFSTGIVWCNSSTAPTKTIGSADVFLTALYL